MNCKQGDIAIVVKSSHGNEGKIVTCTKFLGNVSGFRFDDYWAIDTPITGSDGIPCDTVSDRALKPIRGTFGPDQTLAWKPVPVDCHA